MDINLKFNIGLATRDEELPVLTWRRWLIDAWCDWDAPFLEVGVRLFGVHAEVGFDW